MFDITKRESFNKTIRMPDSLIRKIEKLALEKQVSFNQVVIQCCEYALSELPTEVK
jgi:predicted HicB family RNase H-like nuclease